MQALSPRPQQASQSVQADKERSRAGIQRPQKSPISGVRTNRSAIRQRRLHLTLHVPVTVPQAHASILSENAQPQCKMGVPTCGLRLTRRSKLNGSLLARFPVTDSVRTRQEACAAPRNYPVETLGVGHSEGTPVETALPVGTSPVPAKRVVEAGSPTLSERVSASRVG